LFRGAFVVLLHSHRLCPTIVVNKENIRDLKLVEDKLVPFWPCCTYTFTIMSHLRACWLSQRGRLSTEADKRSTNNGMIFTSISQSSSNKWVDRQHLPQRQQQIKISLVGVTWHFRVLWKQCLWCKLELLFVSYFLHLNVKKTLTWLKNKILKGVELHEQLAKNGGRENRQNSMIMSNQIT
jgi:hypothetical protein